MDGWDEGYNFKVGRYLRVYSATYMYLGARMHNTMRICSGKGTGRKRGGSVFSLHVGITACLPDPAKTEYCSSVCVWQLASSAANATNPSRNLRIDRASRFK